MNITVKPSPNHGGSLRDYKAIILHSTEGSDSGDLSWLTNPASGVSANYLIQRTGKVYELVPPGIASFHAGRGSGFGMPDDNANYYSVGIEISHKGNEEYPKVQLDALDELIAHIDSIKGKKVQIIAHKQWAPGRKTDPTGPFPLAAYQTNRRHSGAGGSVTPPATKPPVSGGDMQTGSIVTYLNSIGKDSSFNNRAKLAVQYGIVSSTSQYKGTAAQNTALLNAMRKGSAPAPKPTPPPASSWFVTTRSATKWRSGPGTNYGVVKSYGPGARIEVSGKVTGQDPYGDGRNQWYKSKVSGLYCWSGTVD